MTDTILQPITLPGRALGWISTVLTAVEEEIHESFQWLPMGHSTDAEIKERVRDAGFYDEVDGYSRMVELLVAMRDLDVALAQCRLPEPLPELEGADA
jgi:hypothetical protein